MQPLIFPKKIVASEHTTLLTNLSESEEKFYLYFVNKLVKIYKNTNKKRVLVGLCGPTGSGKSVLAALTELLANQLNLPFHLKQVGQDGFHYPNSYLLSRTDKGHTLKDYKGRHDTFDALKLKKYLKRYVAGMDVAFPGYSRKTHEPFNNWVQVTESNVLLLVEGIYLLLDKGLWRGISDMFDYIFYIRADKNKVKTKVIDRLRRGGSSLEYAKWHYDNSDAVNFDLIEKSQANADEILEPYYTRK